MEIDEYIFSALEAINDKWTKHASGSDAEAEKGAIEKLKEEIALQKAQIISQQEELMLQKDQVARQNGDIAMLRKTVQKTEDSLARLITPSESIAQCAADESLTVLLAESGNISSDGNNE